MINTQKDSFMMMDQEEDLQRRNIHDVVTDYKVYEVNIWTL